MVTTRLTPDDAWPVTSDKAWPVTSDKACPVTSDKASLVTAACASRAALHTLRAGTRITHEIEVRRSRFLATLARTDDETEARALVADVRADHPQARHHCTAWIIAQDDAQPLLHSNDDGEPAGTAGTHMLDVLRASGLVDVTAVVTRYFGGVLLGTGGLVRAYSSVLSQALERAPRARLEMLTVLEARLSPADAGRIEADLRGAGATVLDVRWSTPVVLRIGARPEEITPLNQRLARLSGGTTQFHPQGTRVIEVDDPACPA